MAKIYLDPNTGDEINASEWWAVRIQNSVIRKWWFLGQFTIITLAVVLTFNVNVVGWWNVYASYLAIFVEAIVGRYMSSQTRRDALIIRELRELIHDVRNLAKTDAKHSEMDYRVDVDSNDLLKEILTILKKNK